MVHSNAFDYGENIAKKFGTRGFKLTGKILWEKKLIVYLKFWEWVVVFNILIKNMIIYVIACVNLIYSIKLVTYSWKLNKG